MSIIVMYFLIYNLTLILFFLFVTNLSNNSLTFNFKTSSFNFNIYFKSVILISLLSLAGLPPLFGFIAKIMLLLVIVNNYSVLNYVIFFIFIFIFLYFYTQNIRLVFANTSLYFNYIFHMGQLKTTLNLFFFTNLTIFILLISPVIVDDVSLLISMII